MKTHQDSGSTSKDGRWRRRLGFMPARREVALIVVCLVLICVSCGCTSSGSFPSTSATQVDLSRNNYRVVKANAVGTSSGFKLFMFIPIVPPRYSDAMSDLNKKAGVAEGKAQAMVNVTQEESSLYLLLFSIPKLTVRADIIEFTD